jgi:glucose/arabinose dehydrogenase
MAGMKLRPVYVGLVLIAALALGGCSGAGASHDAAAHTASTQTPAAAANHSMDHGQNPPGPKLGLQPAVLDGVEEMADAALIKDGELVEADLIRVLGLVDGIFGLPKEGVALIRIEGVFVAWSEKETDYPVKGTVLGPITRYENRVRMPAEQLRTMWKLYYPEGTVGVKDGKLHLTTGKQKS